LSKGDEVRKRVKEAACSLYDEIDHLCKGWVAPVLSRLNAGTLPRFPKIFTDPVWGTIEFLPCETLLLDSPLVQRLRGVRQLGMAHHVYPGGGHDRLEHCRGVVEAAERIMTALAKNAEHRRLYGEADHLVPQPSALDRASIRLAALLHDIGHGPFSHATETLIDAKYREQISSVNTILRAVFDGATSISTSETLAALMILSPSLKTIFEHPGFDSVKKDELPLAIASRTLGSRSYLTAGYLSGVISGPLDADKLDYMSRDSHHAGLPLGLDISRLISKLEVVTITPENSFNPELKLRAEAASGRAYDLGISSAGLGAYEQMIIARVMLYDRIYYHHKVKSAEAMVRKLYMLAEEESGEPLTINTFFIPESDDSVIGILSGRVSSDKVRSGKMRSKELGTALKGRDLYYKAFAFASRFIAGLSVYPEQVQRDHRALIWGKAERSLRGLEERETFAKLIFDKAIELSNNISDLKESSEGLSPEHIIVDLPDNKVSVCNEILTKTHDGQISAPNLFFNPQKWSEAYELQKQCGFVFTPRKYVPVVALASKIIFYEKLQLATTPAADLVAKNLVPIKSSWVTAAVKIGICSSECGAVLTEERLSLVRFGPDDFIIPDEWREFAPELPQDIAEELNLKFRGGLPFPQKKKAIAHFKDFVSFIDVVESTGSFARLPELKEADLQKLLLQHLRSREVTVDEGKEMGGGETDIVLPEALVVENKVIHTPTNNPFNEIFLWQARRYSTTLLSKISYGVVAYKPRDERGYLEKPSRIKVIVASGDTDHAQIQFAIPWGYSSPSHSRVPTISTTAAAASAPA